MTSVSGWPNAMNIPETNAKHDQYTTQNYDIDWISKKVNNHLKIIHCNVLLENSKVLKINSFRF